jgi:pSer/pThr/pTyr-binding forkhead associated (FHA) protein
MSRFHFIIKRERRVEPQQLSADGAAAVSESQHWPGCESPYDYSIMDAGSRSGVYLTGVKVESFVWMPLSEGSTLRFAPVNEISR